MSTQKGNQKHLTLSDRINIEKGLNNSDSFAAIARLVHKDPTTISKEVRKHSKVKEYKGYANIPCEANKDKHSPCMIKHICGDQDCDKSAACAGSTGAVMSAKYTSRNSAGT